MDGDPIGTYGWKKYMERMLFRPPMWGWLDIPRQISYSWLSRYDHACEDCLTCVAETEAPIPMFVSEDSGYLCQHFQVERHNIPKPRLIVRPFDIDFEKPVPYVLWRKPVTRQRTHFDTALRCYLHTLIR